MLNGDCSSMIASIHLHG